MPDFGSEPNAPLAGLALEQPTLPALQLDAGTRSRGDLLASLGDVVAKTAPALQVAPQLQLDGFALGLGLAAPGLESPIDRRVNEAKRAIGAEQYPEALAILVEVVRDAPEHDEGRFLTAYCMNRVGQPLQALRTLRPLRDGDLARRMQTRVATLIRELRSGLESSTAQWCLGALRSGGADTVVTQVRELVDLDPGSGLYHHLLGVALLTAGRLDEGVAALRAGCAACDPEYRDGLADLLRSAEQHAARHYMTPARESWRRGAYARARAELQRLGPSVRQLDLWKVFDRLLASFPGGLRGLLGKAPAPGTEAPPGSPAEMELLYGFLLEQELAQAQAMCALGLLGEAEAILQEVVQRAPHYPFGQFLAGFALYRAVQAASADESPIPLETLIAALETVRERARVGCNDPEIPAAAMLLRTSEELLGRFVTIRRDHELFDVVAREYAAAMDLVKGGIRSEAHAREVGKALQAVSRRLPELRRGIQSAAGREAIAQFEKRITENLKQLDDMAAQMKQTEAVNALIVRFNGRMTQLQRSPIRSRGELEENRRFFQTLRTDVEAARTAAADAEQRRVLDDLHGAVIQVLGQFPA
jgi:hypothetical protein